MSDTAKTDDTADKLRADENKAAAANAATITVNLEIIARELAEIDHAKPHVDDLDNLRRIDELATHIRSLTANIRNLTMKRVVADGTFTQTTLAEHLDVSNQSVSRAIKSVKMGDDA